MTQQLFYEKFTTKAGKVVRIIMTEDRGRITTRIDINALVVSETTVLIPLDCEDEIKVPITDQRKYSEVWEKAIDFKESLDKFFNQ